MDKWLGSGFRSACLGHDPLSRRGSARLRVVTSSGSVVSSWQNRKRPEEDTMALRVPKAELTPELRES
jgi:hypothetical protein